MTVDLLSSLRSNNVYLATCRQLCHTATDWPNPSPDATKKGAVVTAPCLWRKERDSNPRYSCPYTAFRVRPDRPLRHLSNAFCGCKCTNLFFNSNYLSQYFAFFCEKPILKYLFTNIIIIFVMYYIRHFTRLTYKWSILLWESLW